MRKHDKNEKIVNQFHDRLTDLRNTVNKNIILENENPDKVIYIVKKVLEFNGQQKGKGLKIITPK